MANKGVIYVMRSAQGATKIGRSRSDNWRSRTQELTNNGYRNFNGLTLQYAKEVDDYMDVEDLLHQVIDGQILGTEMFATDATLVVRLLTQFKGREVFPNEESSFLSDETFHALHERVASLECRPTALQPTHKVTTTRIIPPATSSDSDYRSFFTFAKDSLFRMDDCLKDQGYVWYGLAFNPSIGDIVYLYSSSSHSFNHKFKIVDAKVCSYKELDQSLDYWSSDEKLSKPLRMYKLQLIATLPSGVFTYASIREWCPSFRSFPHPMSIDSLFNESGANHVPFTEIFEAQPWQPYNSSHPISTATTSNRSYPFFPTDWDTLYAEFSSIYSNKKVSSPLTDIFGECFRTGKYWGEEIYVDKSHEHAIPCALPIHLQNGNTAKGIRYVDGERYLHYNGRSLPASQGWWSSLYIANHRYLTGKAPVRVPEGCVSTSRIAFRNFPEVEGSAAYISRAFTIWCVCTATSGNTALEYVCYFDHTTYVSLSTSSIKSFPLTIQDVRDGILDRYATMTDREVFEDLWSRYKKLTGE